jgi:two-component system osmolarity sensor histidine kinase EnvZ
MRALELAGRLRGFRPFIFLKRFLPKTLLGRSLMIIVTPLIVVQVVSTIIFFERHWETITRRLTSAIAGEIGFVVEELAWEPKGVRAEEMFRQSQRHFLLNMAYLKGAKLPDLEQHYGGTLDASLAKQLAERVRLPFLIDTSSFKERVVIDLQLPGGVLSVTAPGERLFSDTTYIFIFWMVGTSVILLVVAAIFMRNQVKPIRRLAAAADEFGKGREIEGDLHIAGATEVRQAGIAFNLMRGRLRRQLRQRTDMLSGVSHDLRTPLTRMKLQLEMMSGADGVEDLKSDIAEMERMIEGYLAFARGEGNEQMETTDLSDFVEAVVSDWRRNDCAIDCHVEGHLELPVKREAFRRCLNNLIANASRYGDHVWVNAGQRRGAVEITVDDDGPGIPEDERADVFRPFYRLDQSRNPETGGTGLGLAITQDIVRGHGGDIHLTESPQGGLRARIRLPI